MWIVVLGVWVKVMGELLVLEQGEWESMMLGMDGVMWVLRFYLVLCRVMRVVMVCWV